MKIQAKPDGRWYRLWKLTGSWKERNKRLQETFVRDFIGQFHDQVVSRLPRDSWGKAYKEAIVEREISTSLRPGQLAYALVALPKLVKLDDAPDETTAVYVLAKRENLSVLETLLVSYSPWVLDMLPREAAGAKGVKYIHRKVSEDEVLRLRQRNEDVLEVNRDRFRDAGATYARDREDKVEKPASLPDLLFTAVRMEFGIKMKRLAHWSFAFRLKSQTLKGLVKDKRKWEDYLGDPNFTKWVSPLPKMGKIPGQQVLVMLKDFQGKVVQ